MAPLASLTPSQILHLWHQRPRTNHHSRVIAFANDLQRAIHTGHLPQVELTPLSELGLPTGTYNALRRAGYSFIEEIEAMPAQELLLVNLIGVSSIRYIKEALGRWKLARRAEGPPPAVAADPPVVAWASEAEMDELIDAFYAWSTDRERMAALLLRAADKVGDQGPEGLRVMAMGLLDGGKQEVA